MNQLHPIFQSALTPFMPRTITSYETFSYCLNGVNLECELDYTPPEPGSWERGTGLQLDPDFPASVELVFARVKGVDISELLSPEQHAEIGAAFLRQEVLA